MNNQDFNKTFEDLCVLTDEDILSKIIETKKTLGEELALLAHHYQRKAIVDISDFRGDSLELSRIASKQKDAKNIIFCGVHFMAESAAILCDKKQNVYMPEKQAGCPMAEMADLEKVEEVWENLKNNLRDIKVIPITYMNSSAEIKAFCGLNNGAICTSSNAKAVMSWALNQGAKVLFLPDQHLGRNTANSLNIPSEEILLWKLESDLLNGNIEKIRRAKVMLWDGHCHVHTKFTVDHVKTMREKYPEAKIIVHPECPEAVVSASDLSGSTSLIGKYVKEANSGNTIIIGTEINFVSRLAKENPDKKIYELSRSLCPNMFKVNLANLYYTLLHLNEIEPITVSSEIAKNARLALTRMLEIK